MLDAIWWLLTVEAIGLATFPAAYLLLPRLRDRGYSVSKILGVLLVGYTSWILSQLHIVPSVRWSLLAMLLLLAALSGWYMWRHLREFRDFLVRERVAIITAESIFLVLFVGWAIFRSFDPAIDHTEQPMDLAFLNASIESRTGPPEDPWLRGESISYYYFGYWMMAAISQIAGVESNIAYNLAMALIPALGGMAIFGLVYNIVRAESVRWHYAVLGGLSAAILMGFAANLEGVLEFMRANAISGQGFYDWVRIGGLDGPAATPTQSWAPEEFWWWFRATRVINTFGGDQGIDYTIQEFPFFSFMLGDLHPHVMSIPLAVLFTALCWNYLRSPVHDWRHGRVSDYVTLAAMGLVLGGLSFTNMWDLPTFAGLFLGIVGLKAYAVYGGGIWVLAKRTLPVWALVVGVALVLYLPYFLTFRASVSGIAPVTSVTTRPVHLFIVWGLYLVAVAPFILGMFWQTVVREDWRRLTVIALRLGFLPYVVWAVLHLSGDGGSGELPGRLFHVLPFALLISVAVYSALWMARWRGARGAAFSLALAALGLLLVMGPELLYVDDIFGDGSQRMNTVFKLYYQAWILLAAAGGFSVYYWRSLRQAISGWRRSLSMVWASIFIVLLAGSLYYSPAAAASKAREAGGEVTLDGLAFLKRGDGAEYEAIQFVKNNVSRGSAILEAVGEWSDAGLISRSTGVPTIFNWPGHQVQWRATTEKFDGRAEDVRTIYETPDAAVAKALLASYDVEYVYVGPRERATYELEIEKFSSFMLAFSQGDVEIYRMVR